MLHYQAGTESLPHQEGITEARWIKGRSSTGYYRSFDLAFRGIPAEHHRHVAHLPGNRGAIPSPYLFAHVKGEPVPTSCGFARCWPKVGFPPLHPPEGGHKEPAGRVDHPQLRTPPTQSQPFGRSPINEDG